MNNYKHKYLNACKNGDFKTIKNIIDKNNIINNNIFIEGLEISIHNNYTKISIFLIDKYKTFNYYDILHEAIIYHNVEIVEHIINNKPITFSTNIIRILQSLDVPRKNSSNMIQSKNQLKILNILIDNEDFLNILVTRVFYFDITFAANLILFDKVDLTTTNTKLNILFHFLRDVIINNDVELLDKIINKYSFLKSQFKHDYSFLKLVYSNNNVDTLKYMLKYDLIPDFDVIYNKNAFLFDVHYKTHYKCLFELLNNIKTLKMIFINNYSSFDAHIKAKMCEVLNAKNIKELDLMYNLI